MFESCVNWWIGDDKMEWWERIKQLSSTDPAQQEDAWPWYNALPPGQSQQVGCLAIMYWDVTIVDPRVSFFLCSPTLVKYDISSSETSVKHSVKFKALRNYQF